MTPPVGQRSSATHFTTAAPLVLLQALSLQLGSAVAKANFDKIDPVLVAGMRLVVAALIMVVLVRPRVRGFTGREWIGVTAFGAIIATMNVIYFTAIQHLPLGIATTFELLGPLGVAVVFARRILHWIAAGLALVGLCILAIPVENIGLTGLALGVAAGVLRGSYVLLNKYVGGTTTGFSGLVAALAVGAVLALPAIMLHDNAVQVVRPQFLIIGVAVAVLSSVIPYCLDLFVLRRLKVETFGVLMALSPAVGAGVGLAVFGERLSPQAIFGIALIVVASVLAVSRPTSRPNPRRN